MLEDEKAKHGDIDTALIARVNHEDYAEEIQNKNWIDTRITTELHRKKNNEKVLLLT